MNKNLLSSAPGPIGVFDSGYGGLTILRHIRAVLPDYDFLYLGDNARTPYGTRSFQVVYEFTLQCVCKLFEMGCHLVVLACNTASAKALRTIQQIDLPRIDSTRRVLGIIRPTVESIGNMTQTRHVGLLATPGTVKSLSYPLEINKLFPDIVVTGESCPIWVPLVENGESGSDGADFFVRRHVENLLTRDPEIDTVARQDKEICSGKCEDCITGRICCTFAPELSWTSSGDGFMLHKERLLQISDNRICRNFLAECLHFHEWGDKC